MEQSRPSKKNTDYDVTSQEKSSSKSVQEVLDRRDQKLITPLIRRKDKQEHERLVIVTPFPRNQTVIDERRDLMQHFWMSGWNWIHRSVTRCWSCVKEKTSTKNGINNYLSLDHQIMTQFWTSIYQRKNKNDSLANWFFYFLIIPLLLIDVLTNSRKLELPLRRYDVNWRAQPKVRVHPLNRIRVRG